METAKLQATQEFCVPRTKKEVRSFLLGTTGSLYPITHQWQAHLLIDLTRKSNQVVWIPECAAAFEKLKSQLCSAPVLQTPNFENSLLYRRMLLSGEWERF